MDENIISLRCCFTSQSGECNRMDNEITSERLLFSNKYDRTERRRIAQQRFRGDLENVNNYIRKRILANFKKTRVDIGPNIEKKLNLLVSPLLQTRKSVPKWQSDEVNSTRALDIKDLTLAKIDRKRFKPILRFWSKLKVRKDSKKRLDVNPVIPSWGLRHAGETMNAQVRNEIVKTKKLISSQQNNARTNNKQDTKVKPAVAYDYDAAVSQPDVPNFLGQKYNNGLPIRKKGFYSRGKNRFPIRKTAEATSEDTSASNTKSQDKEENEVQIEERKYSKIDLDSPEEVDVSHVEEEMAKKEITSSSNEATPILSKSDFLKNDTPEKDRHKLNSKQRNEIETGENVGNITPRSNLHKKESKIPRTKATTSPAIIQVSRNDSLKRLSISTPKKSFETIANRKDVKREGVKKQIQPKLAASKQQNSDSPKTDRQEEIDETIITETTPAVIGSASDPSTFVGLKGLKQSHECRSCDDYNPETSYQDDDDNLSDSRSSPDRIYIRKKWRRSLKHRKYIDTSSDDFEASSDYSSQSNGKKVVTNSVDAPFKKSTSVAKSSSRSKNRPGSSFSFFNTLFDIVFWPFLFLKSDR